MCDRAYIKGGVKAPLLNKLYNLTNNIMKRYIDLNWNKVEVETFDWINVVEIDWVYFEQEETQGSTIVKIKKNEEITNVTFSNLEEKAKEFLKEKKVKWYGLLKWEKLIEKAKELWME